MANGDLEYIVMREREPTKGGWMTLMRDGSNLPGDLQNATIYRMAM